MPPRRGTFRRVRYPAGICQQYHPLDGRHTTATFGVGHLAPPTDPLPPERPMPTGTGVRRTSDRLPPEGTTGTPVVPSVIPSPSTPTTAGSRAGLPSESS